MNIREEYMRLRRKGWMAREALRAARIRHMVRQNSMSIKLEAEPDQCGYDDSYLEEMGLTPRQLKYEQKELQRHLELNGVWVLSSYFRPTAADPWILVDSVGGIVGLEADDGGYCGEAIDLLASALHALEEEPGLAAKFN